MTTYLRTPESHPPGYNGMYSAVELKKGIIQFLISDRKKTGRTQHATKDIIFGLKQLFGIEFDLHSVEYVMKHMMTSEGSKLVGNETIDAVTKKCSDGKIREFVKNMDTELVTPATCHSKKEKEKSESDKPNIPKNLTEDELYKLYRKLSMSFACGATYNPRTFKEFKQSSGY